MTLDRETDTLSGGESQRVKMVKHLSGSLMDVMYVFDEPSVGLHPRDVHRFNGLLQKLRDKGNTVIVVEHDPDVIKVADHIVDVGPHAGSRGGHDRLSKAATGLLQADTLTGTPYQAVDADQGRFRAATGKLPIKDASVQQPAERERRYSNGRADGRHGRGRLGQELTDQRGVSAASTRMRS